MICLQTAKDTLNLLPSALLCDGGPLAQSLNGEIFLSISLEHVISLSLSQVHTYIHTNTKSSMVIVFIQTVNSVTKNAEHANLTFLYV